MSAAALGCPTWRFCCKFVPDWRRLLNRDDSALVPTAWLFRQTERRDWADVLGRVKRELVSRFLSSYHVAADSRFERHDRSVKARRRATLFQVGQGLLALSGAVRCRMLFDPFSHTAIHGGDGRGEGMRSDG